MFLSQLVLNPRSREVRRDLADCHQMHRTLMSAWPSLPVSTDIRRELGMLYRIEPVRPGERTIVLVQSLERPGWQRLPKEYVLSDHGVACKSVVALYAGLHAGMRLRFRLRANPTRFIRPPERPGGQRVDLRREADKVSWLLRKGRECGFSVPSTAGVADVIVHPTERLLGRRRAADDPSAVITIAASLFEGVLEVTDADRFREALRQGVGRAKAYGCGLLSVARVPV